MNTAQTKKQDEKLLKLKAQLRKLKREQKEHEIKILGQIAYKALYSNIKKDKYLNNETIELFKIFVEIFKEELSVKPLLKT